MEDRRFDVALQLHGGGANSNLFTRQLGARVTAGLRARGAPPLDRWVRYTYFQHEVLRYIEAVALVGASTPSALLDLALAVTPTDRREADAVVGAHPAPLAVLHPGATDPRRRWPVSRFASIGRELAAQGLDVIVTGDTDDISVAAAVTGQVDGRCRSVAGTLSVGGLLGVLERATVVISNDSGPLHLAAAVGTRTVGIYWCGNAVNGGPTTTQFHRPVISWRTRCPVCGVDCMRGRCDHETSFVSDIAAADVLDEVDVLLTASSLTAPGRSEGTTRLTAGRLSGW